MSLLVCLNQNVAFKDLRSCTDLNALLVIEHLSLSAKCLIKGKGRNPFVEVAQVSYRKLYKLIHLLCAHFPGFVFWEKDC